VSSPRPEPPPEVKAAAHARAAARAAHDWPRADALKAEIEAAGWKVIDRGTDFRLDPAAPPTVEDGETVRYGSSAAVPSVLDEGPSAAFSVQLLAEDWPTDLARTLAGLRTHAPAGTQVVVVANAPAPAQADRLVAGHPDLADIGGSPPEVVWTSTRLGEAAARNVGLRRARGEIVVLAETSTEPIGDALTPLAQALADPSIAVAGGFGVVTTDLRRFDEATGPAADAIDLAWLAFRREDYATLGPLDEKFAFYRHLDTWWSLVLRVGADGDAPARGAVRLDLPLVRHEHRGWTTLSDADRDRLGKRNFYRVLERFREHPDLRSRTR
jgi:cysteinyl-tRNA synthetase